MTFEWPVRVYIEDTDLGGIVYHANYLNFMERARTEWLRNLGFNQTIFHQQGVLLVVRSLQIDYKTPAHLDDELIVSVAIEHVRKVGLILQQQVVHKLDQQLLATAKVEITCINLAGAVQPLPSSLLTAINH